MDTLEITPPKGLSFEEQAKWEVETIAKIREIAREMGIEEKINPTMNN